MTTVISDCYVKGKKGAKLVFNIYTTDTKIVTTYNFEKLKTDVWEDLIRAMDYKLWVDDKDMVNDRIVLKTTTEGQRLVTFVRDDGTHGCTKITIPYPSCKEAFDDILKRLRQRDREATNSV